MNEQVIYPFLLRVTHPMHNKTIRIRLLHNIKNDQRLGVRLRQITQTLAMIILDIMLNLIQ